MNPFSHCGVVADLPDEGGQRGGQRLAGEAVGQEEEQEIPHAIILQNQRQEGQGQEELQAVASLNEQQQTRTSHYFPAPPSARRSPKHFKYFVTSRAKRTSVREHEHFYNVSPVNPVACLLIVLQVSGGPGAAV